MWSPATAALALIAACTPGGEPDGPIRTAPHATHDRPVPAAEPLDTGGSGDTTGDGLVFTEGVPKNLLIVSFDTLRYDAIGAYAGTQNTPFLDGLLDEAVLLTNLRGCSNWTYASVLCLMTGRSTVDLGFEPVTADPDALGPPDQLDMLPLWLRRRGFETAVVTGSPWLTDEPGVLTGEGFDTIVYNDMGDPSEFPSAEWTAQKALTQAQSMVGGVQDRWYLHVHFMDPHTPYDAPQSYRDELSGDLDPIDYDLTTGKGLQEAKQDYLSLSEHDQDLLLAHFLAHYEADIRFMDDQLEDLWSGLENLGALDDTLVLFWSDHGEQFYEHRKWGHSQALHQEENRALAAWWAQGLTPKVWKVPVQHQDLVHLIYRALRLKPEPGWTGSDPDEVPADRLRTAFRYHLDTDAWWMATRENDLLTYRCDGAKGLYDVGEDPGEQDNLYDPDDPLVTSLWADLDAEIDRSLAYLPHLDCEARGP